MKPKDYLKNNTAEVAWCALGATVAAYEWFAPPDQLLTHAAHRSMDKHPLITAGIVGAFALHLIRALPDQHDPINIIGRKAYQFKRRQAEEV